MLVTLGSPVNVSARTSEWFWFLVFPSPPVGSLLPQNGHVPQKGTDNKYSKRYWLHIKPHLYKYHCNQNKNITKKSIISRFFSCVHVMRNSVFSDLNSSGLSTFDRVMQKKNPTWTIQQLLNLTKILLQLKEDKELEMQI